MSWSLQMQVPGQLLRFPNGLIALFLAAAACQRREMGVAISSKALVMMFSTALAALAGLGVPHTRHCECKGRMRRELSFVKAK